MKTTNINTKRTIEQLRADKVVTEAAEAEMAARCAIEDPFGIIAKANKMRQYVNIVATKDDVTTWFEKARGDLIAKMEQHFTEGYNKELSFIHIPEMKEAQEILTCELSTDEGKDKMVRYAMKLGSVLTTKGKVASADAIETGVRVLEDYYHINNNPDLEYKYKMVEYLSAQLIELMQGVILRARSEKTYSTDDKGHNEVKDHWFEDVLMPVTFDTLLKKLDVRNLPTWSRDLRDTQIRDIYKTKTFFHRKLQHSVAVLEYLDYVQKFEITVGEIGTTSKELDTWLEGRSDWKDISAIPTDTNPNPRYSNRNVYKARTINKIQGYVGKPIHFPQSMEGRGRMKYRSTSLGLNPHGDSYETALLELFNKRIITDEGGYQLSLLISTEMFGRVSERKNVKAFKDNWDKGLVWKNNCPKDLYNRKLWAAYADYRNGIPSGFIARIDGTNSGLQFISTGIKDEVGAKYSNIAGHKEVYDAYGLMASAMNTALNITENQLTRVHLKDGFTVTMYGAGSHSAITAFRGRDASKLKSGEFYIPADREIGQHPSLYETVKDRPELSHLDNETIIPRIKCTERQIFIMRAFDEAFVNSFPAVVEAIATISSAYGHSVMKLGNLQHSWQLPDGFVAQSVNYKEGVANTIQYVVKSKSKTGKFTTNSRKIIRNAPSRKARILSLFANLTHSLDGYALRQVSQRLGAEILTKHDDFGVHANDIVALKELYSTVVYEIAKEGLLQKLLNDALSTNDGSTIEAVLPCGDLDISRIKSSLNALR